MLDKCVIIDKENWKIDFNLFKMIRNIVKKYFLNDISTNILLKVIQDYIK